MNEIAYRKWLKLPKDIRLKLEHNVWCGNCSSAVQIVDYKVDSHKLGITLTGKCKICGNEVARVVENN